MLRQRPEAAWRQTFAIGNNMHTRRPHRPRGGNHLSRL
jgi:hypothetical protein